MRPVTEQNPTRMIRRTLEEALETRTASAVLFEALSASGKGVPQTRSEFLAVVSGPLREALHRRLEADYADELVHRIARQLMPRYDEPMTVEATLDDLALTTRDDEATTAFPTEDRAVRVLVVAAGGSFASRLAMALGENRAAPRAVGTPDQLRLALLEGTPPPIFVVDASDVAPIEAARVAHAGDQLPTTTACVLWGSELPYGRTFAKAVSGQRRNWVLLEVREGIAPLLDLVRSRRKSMPPPR
jgi:hypothetical protein